MEIVVAHLTGDLRAALHEMRATPVIHACRVISGHVNLRTATALGGEPLFAGGLVPGYCLGRHARRKQSDRAESEKNGKKLFHRIIEIGLHVMPEALTNTIPKP